MLNERETSVHSWEPPPPPTRPTPSEIVDESYTDNRVDDEANESEKKPSGYAFLNLKKPELKEKKIGKDNLVGLLLPLTGEKSAAGNLVINSFVYLATTLFL